MWLRLTVACVLLMLLAGQSHQTGRHRRQASNGEPCVTPRQVPGVCVNIKNCPLHLDYLVNRRKEPEILKYLQDSVCYKQGSQVFTCCPEEKSGNSGGGESCLTPKRASGQCINIKKCKELLDMLKDRSNQTVSQYLRASQCGYEGRVPKVCCPGGTQGGSEDSGGGGGDLAPAGNGTSLPGLDVCGKNGLLPDKVVKGQPAALGSWPWMVALGYRSSKNPLNWRCGGSLISNRYVVTAAHCVTNLGRWTLYLARVGDLDLKDSVRDNATPMDIPVEKITPHENFNPRTMTVDIALIKLRNIVQFTRLIRPVCLPTPDSFDPDLTGYTPFITGWGATSFKGPSDTHLQEAQVEITDVESCAKAYEKIKGATIDDRVICAESDSGKDACQGDSGGPLVLPKTAGKAVNYFLIGVVSFGYKCAEPGFPGIYSKVSLYLDWIKRNMK